MLRPAITLAARSTLGSTLLLLACLLTLGAKPAAAHPEDEFCLPGQNSLDPALCEQLMALDSGDFILYNAILGGDC